MIRGAVNRPVLTAVCFAILILLGIFGWTKLPVSLFPDITLPSLIVLTEYRGASAFDVEEQISKVLEDALSSLSNLKTIKSESRENISLITLEFEYGTNLDEAANDVRDALGFAFLPEDAGEPKLLKISGSMAPVIAFTVSSQNPGIDLKKVLEEEILDELERVPGVGSAEYWGGGASKQINIDVSQVKLEEFGISLLQIVQVLKANNLNFPLGKLEQGGVEYNLRLPGKFKSLEEIEKIVVGVSNEKLVELQDIATVSWGVEEKRGYFRRNGEDAGMFGIFKKPGANTVIVAKLVKKRVEELTKRYPGLNFEVIFDLSKIAEDSVNNLKNTISIAVLLVIIVSFLLLGNLRASLIIAITIPISLIISFIYLYLSDSSLNIVSLSAIAIAVGMVVDNAVVVLENIYKHRELGETPKEASIFGAQEVTQAILASTLTTIVIFLPLMLTRGFVSVLFKELSITMPLMLSVSLVTAITFIPMISARFLKMENKESLADRFFSILESGYSNMLDWVLSNKGKVIGGFIIVFLLGIFLFRFVPLDFFPNTGSDQLHGKIELPEGTRLEKTNEIAKKVEELIWKEVPETKSITTAVGGSGGIFGMTEGSHTITLYITIGKTKKTKFQIADELNKKTKGIPGIKESKFTVIGGIFGGEEEIAFGGAPIEVEIIGDNLEKADSLAEVLKERLLNVEGISSIEISRKKGGKELWLIPQSSEMYSYGFSAYSVGYELRTAFYGTEAGKFSEEGKEYPIIVRLDNESRNSFETIDNFQLRSQLGTPIHISNFLKPMEKRAPISIERNNKARTVRLKISVSGPLSVIMQEVKKVVDSSSIPKGLTISYGGQAKQQMETFKSLVFAIILGIILVYLVMAAQFESLLDPFIIMFSLPFGFVGVALGYWITLQSMSLMGMVGIAMLVGIVVNNAIVMIDFFNILRKRGMELVEAVKEGAKRRLRPILITSGTTIFGLLPLAVSRGTGSGLWRSLGISVSSGMIVSTLITLFLIPTLYTIFETKIKRSLE
ncbi:MAG: efflux RND transporter permease subunit [candidate division WOR-3 bacterium]